MLRADLSLLAAPLPGPDDYLEVEALYAATHEGALHVEDVLARRTRISIEARQRDPRCRRGPEVADLMGGPARLDRRGEETGDRPLPRSGRRRACRESQTKPDDELRS